LSTETGSIGVIVATHGNLAKVVVETAGMILGQPARLQPFTFPEGEAPKASYKRLQALIQKCDTGQGVIILVDLFGGTPGSLALSMLDDKQVEVLTGVNLAMALAAATLDPGLKFRQACSAILKSGRDSIKEAGALLNT
jgi:PTS system mannose-specific IIA component